MCRYVYAYMLGHHSSVEWTPFTCFFFEFLLETTPQIFHTTTIWLTLVLALHRYIHVCLPSLSKRTCTVKLAVTVVVLVMLMAVIIMAPRFIDRSYTVEERGSEILFNCVF